MTIIQSLIASLEKNNNNKLIEKLEILEKFVSSESNKLSTEALNKLISDRVKSNNEQEGIKNTKEEENSKLSESVEKEVIETETNKSEDIMGKFKWVLIGIGIFVLLIFISGIIYWYMNMSSTPSEVPILQPVVTPTDKISQPYHIQNNVDQETQEYSYIPEIFQRNSKGNEELLMKNEELRVDEERKSKNELIVNEEGRSKNELRVNEERRSKNELMDDENRRSKNELIDDGKRTSKNELIDDEKRTSKNELIDDEKRRTSKNELIDELIDDKKRTSKNELIDELIDDEKRTSKNELIDELIDDEKRISKNKEDKDISQKEQEDKDIVQKEQIVKEEDILKNKAYKLSSKSNFPY